MYRKIHTLMQQLESKTVDIEKARLLLDSVIEQTDASGNSEAYVMAYNAWSLMPEYHEKINPIRENLELLMWSLAEKDIEKIERLLTNQHGFSYERIDDYRDSGVITEHFTPNGNLVVWIKHEKTTPYGTKMRCEFMAYLKNGRVKIGICDPHASLDVMLENIDMKIASQQ